MWPIASAQAAKVVVLGCVAVIMLKRVLLTLVSVVQSLYPAFTILLARVVLGERLQRRQIAGLALAAVGVTVIGIS